MVLHQSRNRPNNYGGTRYGTLCGRMNRNFNDGMNVALEGQQVTCKFCLKLMEYSA